MYDAIVVGARCAGAPTAMLLAREGYSVVLLDRATFPSDTVSTHIVKYPAVSRLESWDLLDEVLATGCPPITRCTSDYGDGPVSGRPPPPDEIPIIAPRRTILDEILVEAALEAGAELREEFVVRELLTDGDRVVGIEGQHRGGPTETMRARMVIGADGKNSLVARSVEAPTYDDVPPQAFWHYTYWPELPVDGLEWHWRHHEFVLAIPTNDDLTCLMVGRPIEYLQEFRTDIESSYHDVVAIAPEFADVVERVDPVGGFVGTAVPNYFRRPYGPGWALVGDAGLCMDPLMGHGISDALCDAELLAEAVDAGLSERRPLEDALAEYEATRNERKAPYYERNWQGARFEGWDRPEELQLRAALREDPEQANRWAGTIAFSVGLDEFYSSEFVSGARSAVPDSGAG